VDGSTAIAALQGAWILSAEAVDYAGNISAPSAPVRFAYPDACAGVAVWSASEIDAGDRALDARPSGDGTGGDGAADSRPAGGEPAAANCGCRIGSRSGSPPLVLVLAVAALGRRSRRTTPRDG
jgi:MYXO-CTERM domain-containing protein